MSTAAAESYNVEIGGSIASSLTKSFEELDRKLQSLQKRISGLSGASLDRQDAGRKWDSFNKLTGNTASQRREAKMRKMIGDSYTPDVWRKEIEHTKNFTTYQDALEKKTRELISARKELTRVTESMLARESTLARMRKDDTRLQRASEKMNSIGRGAVAAGAGMSAAGGSLLYGASLPVRKAADFQQATANLLSKGQFSSDTVEKQKQLEQLRTMAHRQGYRVGGASNAMQGIAEMAAAGMRPDEILKAMPSVANLAVMSDMGVSQTSDLATNVMSQFGMGAGQMKEFANIAATFDARSEAGFADLAQAMIYGGSTASGMGVSLEDTTGIMTALRSKGIGAGNPSMMGTVTSDLLTRIMTATGSDASKLEEHGVSVETANKDIIGTLTTLSASLARLPASERQKTIKDLFGVEGGRGMNALMTKDENGIMAIESAKKHADAYRSARGGDYAETAKGVKDATFWKSMERVSNAFSSLAVRLGEPLLTPLTKLGDMISGTVQWFSDLLDPTSEVAKEHTALSYTFQKLASVSLPVVGVLGGLLLAAGAVVTAFGAVAIAAGSMTNAIRTIKGSTRAGRFAQMTGRGGRSSRMLSGYGTGDFNPDVYSRRGVGGSRGGRMSRVMRGGRGILGGILSSIVGGIAGEAAFGGLGGGLAGNIAGDVADTAGDMATESLLGRMGRMAKSGFGKVKSLGGRAMGGVAKYGGMAMRGAASYGGAALTGARSLIAPMIEGIGPMLTGAFSRAAPMLGRLFSVAGPVGLAVGAAVAGWQIGTWMDTQFGISEKVAAAIYAGDAEASNALAKKTGGTQIDASRTVQATKGKGDATASAQRQAQIDKLMASNTELDAKLATEKAEREKLQAWYNPISRALYGETNEGEIAGLEGMKKNNLSAIDHLKFQQESGGYDYNVANEWDADKKKYFKRPTINSEVKPEDQEKVSKMLDALTRTLNPSLASDPAKDANLQSSMTGSTQTAVDTAAAKSVTMGDTNVTKSYQPVINLNGVGMADVAGMVKKQVRDTLSEHELASSQKWANDFEDTAELA